MQELQGGTLEDLRTAARNDPNGEAISYRGNGLQVELWYFAPEDEHPEEYRYVVCDNGKYIGCFEPDVVKYFE